MSTSLQSASVYTDLQGLNQLQHNSSKDPSETLRFVAEQFEAIFLQIMLKSAHGESGKSDLFEGDEQTEFYQDWHDKQLAIHLSSGKGIGIADMLVKQFQVHQAQQVYQSTGNLPNTTLDKKPSQLSKAVSQTSALASKHTESMDAQVIKPAEDVQSSVTFDSPEAFVNHLWPMAKQAAEKMGITPEVLLAQAALETGWGRKIAQHASGKSSHNLFNIKADNRWDGEDVSISTLEFRSGIPQQEKANFRAYDTFQASFNDYVEFIQNSPRYQPAMAVASDAKAYTQELSRAGYATDPEYAQKIMGIIEGKPLKQALSAVKI